MSDTPKLTIWEKHIDSPTGFGPREPSVAEVVVWLREQGAGEVRQWHQPITMHPKGRPDLGDDLPPGRYLVVPLDTEPPKEITHKAPEPDSGIVPCCGRTPFELPRLDRMTLDDDLVTCTEPPKETE